MSSTSFILIALGAIAICVAGMVKIKAAPARAFLALIISIGGTALVIWIFWWIAFAL